jgi:hypothetical protein
MRKLERQEDLDSAIQESVSDLRNGNPTREKFIEQYAEGLEAEYSNHGEIEVSHDEELFWEKYFEHILDDVTEEEVIAMLKFIEGYRL